MILQTLTTIFDSDSTGLTSGLSKAISLGDTFQKKMASIGATTAKVGAGISAGLGIPLLAFGKASIQAASDAEETASKFNTVFGDISDSANQMSSDLQRDFGLAEQSAQKLLGNTGDLLTGFGFSQDKALELSNTVARLGSDLASFTNYSGGAVGATNVLTKALLGQTDGLNALGISFGQVDIKKLAEEKGIVGELTRQQKAMLILELAATQSKNAIGDYGRTSGSVANQMRKMSEGFLELKTTVGEMLTEVLDIPSVFTSINSVLQKAVEWFKGLNPTVQKFITYGGLLGIILGPVVIAIGGLVAFLAPLIGFLGGTGLAILGVVGTVGALLLSIIGIKGGFKEVGNGILNFAKNTIGFFMNFKENAGLIADWFRENWLNLFYDLGQFIMTFLMNSIANIYIFGTKLQAGFGAITGWLLDNWDNLIIDIVNGIVGMGKKVLEITFAIGKGMLDAIKNGFKGGKVDLNIFDNFIQGAAQTGTLKERFAGALANTPGFKVGAEGAKSTTTELKLNTDFSLGTKEAEDDVKKAVKTGVEDGVKAGLQEGVIGEIVSDSIVSEMKYAGALKVGSVEAFSAELKARNATISTDKKIEQSTMQTAQNTNKMAKRGVKIDGIPTVRIENLAVANF